MGVFKEIREYFVRGSGSAGSRKLTYTREQSSRVFWTW